MCICKLGMTIEPASLGRFNERTVEVRVCSWTATRCEDMLLEVFVAFSGSPREC